MIFGAVGDVLGSSAETILKLKGAVKHEGYILIDDAFSANSSDERYLSKEQWLQVFRDVEVKLVSEKVSDYSELVGINKFNQECIIKRAIELKNMHPEKVDMFEGYIRSQRAECDDLESEIVGVTWLLQVVSR